MKKKTVLKTYELCGFVKIKTAKELKISVSKLSALLKIYEANEPKPLVKAEPQFSTTLTQNEIAEKYNIKTRY